MQQRENIGYVITDSVKIGDTEFVIATHKTDSTRFATWACENGNNYYWGHYMNTREAAERDLVSRLNDQLRLLDSIRGRPHKSERSTDAR